MKSTPRRCRKLSGVERGYTLVELVLAILLLSLAAGVFVGAFQEGNAMYDTVEARKELVQEGRAALLRVLREIRQVRSAQDVTVAQQERVAFYSVTDSLLDISFSGASGELSLTRGSKQWVMASAVDSFALTYLKNDGTAAVPLVSPNSTDIFQVKVFLRLSRGGKSVSLEGGTYLRNLE